MRMTECMPGCVFDHRGRIPESVYRPECFSSPLEEAVYNNNVTLFKSLVKEGHTVTIRLKIGQMSCLEYAAMMGYMEMLEELISASVCSQILRQYFALDDVVERAYMISKNKGIFFDQEALVEANRYVAALYTAIVYNKPKCVELMLGRLSLREPAYKHSFYRADGLTLEPHLTASDLARILGHMECYRIIQKRQQSTVEY